MSAAQPTTVPPPVVVLGPDPLLSVTIERAAGADDVHLHAAGQGVWVARMAHELGARPTLCGLLGGETGTVLEALLTAAGGELRATRMAGSSGSYVIDDRDGGRAMIAASTRPAPHRHELDDLVASTVAAALGSRGLAICNPYPAEGFPSEVYETVLADVRGRGVPVVVDLSSPRLEHALPHAPDLVKLNDWELAEYVRGPVDGNRAVDAARRLLDAGATAVAVTRAEAPVLVVGVEDEPFEIVPPSFPAGHREGTGDAMTGAILAALARGLGMREALVLGVAAGSGNYLRHGLGTGRRHVVEALARRVTIRPLQNGAVSSTPFTIPNGA